MCKPVALRISGADKPSCLSLECGMSCQCMACIWSQGYCSIEHTALCFLQDLDDTAAPLLGGTPQKKARQRAVVLPKIDLTRFYHARTCVQMSRAEVEGILADPQRASDSDDEEDVEDWKVT